MFYKKLACGKKILNAFLLSIVVPLFSFSQDNGQSTQWKGFEKLEFNFEGRSARLIKPHTAAEQRPWIWRAHFPDWHTDMDSILLSRGFHVAYINTNNLYGHPIAMQVWDRFYDFLLKKYGLAPKVALEGVSRGGLYVYGWAKRNPEKVSCIYAEAPVCDPKSWPGGKGKGKGAQKEWNDWLELYGLDEEKAKDFGDIPLNGLAGLAGFRVPILHVVGLRDKIVPVAENTNVLVENYMRLGGPVTVIPMTGGAQNLEGHHFEIEHPEQLADWVYNHTMPIRERLDPLSYIHVNGGMRAAFEKFRRTKTGTVTFLGGSITYGPGWRDKVSAYLRERFPDVKLQFINAGIGSLGSTPHAFRFGRDVLGHGVPDLLFVEAAVNDRVNGFDRQSQLRAIEGILRQMYASNPSASVVLMAFADPMKNDDYAADTEPVEVAVHRELADRYGASFINLAKEVYDRMEAKEFSWKYDFKDLHPSPFGQEIYFSSIKALLNAPFSIAPTRKKIPAPVDRLSYSGGGYVLVEKAVRLKDFAVDPRWEPTDGKGTREGFVRVPVLEATTPGASFELQFEGTAVGIAVAAGPDAGTISYTIDGKKYDELDLFTKWSSGLHLPWYLVLDDQLKKGKHRLVVTVSKNRNDASQGNACRVVHFLVNQ